MFDFVALFSGISRELATVLIACLPIAELRVSIPIALEVYHLPLWKAVGLSLLGNMLPVTFILLVIPAVHQWLLRARFVGGVFKKFLSRAEKSFSSSYAKYGAIGLVIFVGIPLPMTGAWTGALAAFIFNIPFRKSWPLIFLGVCMAAAIVTLLTLFGGGALRRLL
ncbi:MAG: small multi-drug export protein [Candidatus Magasanikbacteria bacterium]|nr:small multi-drug export protein [Candidatus Magasanikbacteria bacterium]